MVGMGSIGTPRSPFIQAPAQAAPSTKHTLRFTDIPTPVLDQFDVNRVQQESRLLFGETLDVFVKRDAGQAAGTVELSADKPNAKSLFFGSGALRYLTRQLTNQDPKPQEKIEAVKQPLVEHSGDLFARTIRSEN